MSSHTRHDKKTSAFLALPAELRNHIYQLLLVAPQPIQLALEDNGRRATVGIQNWYEASPSANILATCKQINREAGAYLYGDNTLTFQHDPRALSAFLARIKKSAMLVRKINIVNLLPKSYATLAITALQHAPNLASLHIAYVPRSVYNVSLMADLLLPWAKAAAKVASKGTDWMEKLAGLKFYHIDSPSGQMGPFKRPGMLDTTIADGLAERYTSDVKARILRLIKVKKE